VVYSVVPSPVTLIDLQGHVGYFCVKISVVYFLSRRLWRCSKRRWLSAVVVECRTAVCQWPWRSSEDTRRSSRCWSTTTRRITASDFPLYTSPPSETTSAPPLCCCSTTRHVPRSTSFSSSLSPSSHCQAVHCRDLRARSLNQLFVIID